MNRTLPATTPPRFCSICGRALLDDQSIISNGYDPMTGQSLGERPHITRRCVGGCVVWVLQQPGTPSATWVLA